MIPTPPPDHTGPPVPFEALGPIVIGSERRRMLLILGEGPRSAEELAAEAECSIDEARRLRLDLVRTHLAIECPGETVEQDRIRFQLTDRAKVWHEGTRAFIRVSNHRGEAVQVDFTDSPPRA